MSAEEWRELVNSFETTIKSTSTTHQQICDTLDRLSDAIISGTPIPAEVLPEIVPPLVSLFDPKTFWCYKHTACFALNHIVKAFGESLKEMKLYDPIVNAVFSSISDPKRELRDAIAQSLGVFSQVYGTSLVESISPKMLQLSRSPKDYTHLEGLVMAIGYVVANCSEITKLVFDSLTSILREKATTKLFGAYGRYIRYYSSKSIELITRNNNKWDDEQLRDIQERIVKSLIIDQDFSTRRACSMLYEAVARTKNLSAENILQFVTPALTTSPTWEGRHTVFLIIQRCAKLICSSSPTKFYPILNEHLKTRPSEGKIGYQANASAGQALIHLSVHEQTSSERTHKTIYENLILPSLSFMLGSGESYLLDCVSQCIQFVLSHPEYSRLLLENIFQPEQLGMIMKNKFHASMPIRNSSTVLWRALEEKKGEKKSLDVDCGCSILSFFSKFLDDRRLDYEVVESVLKAIGHLVSQDGIPVFEDSSLLLNIVTILMKESSSDSIRRSSEVTRSASLASLLQVVKRDRNKFMDLMIKEKKIDGFVELVKNGMLDVLDESVAAQSLGILGELLGYFHEEGRDAVFVLDNLFPVFVFGFGYDDDLKKRSHEIISSIGMGDLTQAFSDEENGFSRLIRAIGSLSMFVTWDSEYDVKEAASKCFSGLPMPDKIGKGRGNVKREDLEKLYDVIIMGWKTLDEDLVGPLAEYFAALFGKCDELVVRDYEYAKDLVALGLHYLINKDMELEGTDLGGLDGEEKAEKPTEGNELEIWNHVKMVVGKMLEVNWKEDEGEWWSSAKKCFERTN